jgi:hypothetical protein
MACEITGIEDAVLYVRISGIMKLTDQQSLHTAGMKLIAKDKKVRVLVTLENFQGWEQGADWSDVGFLITHGNDIVKIAFVGDERWKDLAFAFVGKGLRTTEIEFFSTASSKEAESWIHA